MVPMKEYSAGLSRIKCRGGLVHGDFRTSSAGIYSPVYYCFN